MVHKTHKDLDRSSSREPGARCLLYEARTIQSIKGQRADEHKLLARLQAANPKAASSQIMDPSSESTQLLENQIWQKPSRWLCKLSAIHYCG